MAVSKEHLLGQFFLLLALLLQTRRCVLNVPFHARDCHLCEMIHGTSQPKLGDAHKYTHNCVLVSRKKI